MYTRAKARRRKSWLRSGSRSRSRTPSKYSLIKKPSRFLRRTGPKNVSYSMRSNRRATDGIRIRHREMIQDLIMPAGKTYDIKSFRIQPGLQQNFPWLSGLS